MRNRLPTLRDIPEINQEFNELGSWFGQYNGQHAWVDRGDNGINASGLPQDTLGIAFYCKDTLRHYWNVTLPNGFNIIVQQVDLGPHPRTGRGIDINAALADLAGYSPKTFPTDVIIKFVYLGPTVDVNK
jgi:hypothetical protein